ncbi:hypothetical protein GW17_00057454 [Ensete ventricosum]|nr:hypothetical protein GW17_00057454 [Ensete ventricosum]
MLEATKLSQEEGEVDDQRRVQFSPDPSKLADGTCRFGFKGRKQRKEDGRRWRKCRGLLRRKEMRRKKQLQAHDEEEEDASRIWRCGCGTGRGPSNIGVRAEAAAVTAFSCSPSSWEIAAVEGRRIVGTESLLAVQDAVSDEAMLFK